MTFFQNLTKHSLFDNHLLSVPFTRLNLNLHPELYKSINSQRTTEINIYTHRTEEMVSTGFYLRPGKMELELENATRRTREIK